jgi:hypothetical protein
MQRNKSSRALALTTLLAAACGGRPSSWDAEVSLPIETVGLKSSVAVVDPSLDQVILLRAPSGRELEASAAPVGKNVVSALPATDMQSVVVLSRGVQPRRNPEDQRPSLSVIDGASGTVSARYTLTDPLQGLALDPEGRWAVVFDAGGIVVNPNELIFVDLENPDSEPVTKTIRSFGGRPERLTFTSELGMPDGTQRRFLIVETEQDVTLVDLSDLERDEVTIFLPKTPAGLIGRPREVAFHDGAPDDPNDARVAVRLANDPNVVIVELGPPGDDAEGRPFKATLNVAPVDGVPSAIAFVQTDGGLRLAALVPTTQSAALSDPATTVAETVTFPKPFSRLTRVTDVAPGAPGETDVALLWSEQVSGIAFWSLGSASGTPFRSVDTFEIGIVVSDVKDVPSQGFGHKKILESLSASEFYVLDLDARQSSPMLTNAAGFQLTVAPDGLRAWALRPGTPQVSSIDLATLHPTSVEVERDVFAVHDIERLDGGRSLVLLHGTQAQKTAGLGATVLDARDPDTASSQFHGGLMLGALP